MNNMKILMVIALIGILVALASAGAMMLKRRGGDDASPSDQPDARMARALAWRVGISVALFLAVLAAWMLGWISPQGVPVTRG